MPRTRGNGSVIGQVITPGGSGVVAAQDATQYVLSGQWPGTTYAPISGASVTISSIVVTDSGYNNLDDTAAATSNSYIRILGSGFSSTANVFLNGTMVPKANITFVSSSELRARLPVSNTGNYAISVFNSNTAGALHSNTFVISTMPQWLTSATLSNQFTGTAFSVNLSATSDSAVTYSNTTALPAGTTLAANGLFSGTITVGSQTSYSFDVKATDAENQDTTRTFSLTVTAESADFLLTAESGLTNTGTSINNPGSISNSGASISSARAAVGTNSVYFNGSACFDLTNTGSDTWSPLSRTPYNGVGMTVELNIYPESVAIRGVIISHYRATQEKGWTIDYDNGGRLFFARDSAGASTNSGTYELGLSLNTWTKLGFVFRADSSNHLVEIWKNGSLHGTYNYGTAATFSTGYLRFGRRGDNSLGMIGNLDDIRIWVGSRGPY